MGNRNQSPSRPDPEISYFDLQAYIGTTKHMGGYATTEELIALCHVDAGAYVLDVGCGAGATTCHLARECGCRVVGVDLRESMVDLARERARREGVAERVEFRVADAGQLPYEEGTFDAVLCESVLTFVADKPRAVREFARVTRPGGYVGLNEEFWLRPPTAEMAQYAQKTWDIAPDVVPREAWVALLEDAGLQDVVARTYQFDTRRESTQIKRYRLGDMARMIYRTVALYVRSPALRAYMKERRRMPKDMFRYLGYGLFVGRRP